MRSDLEQVQAINIERVARYVCRPWCYTRDYEDLLQEARVAAWDALQRYDPERGAKPLTWAVSQAKGRVLHYVNRIMPHTGPRREVANRPEVLLMADVPAESAGIDLDTLTLTSALDRLCPELRELLVDYYWRGITKQAQAQARHLHANTIRRRHERALAALRDLL